MNLSKKNFFWTTLLACSVTSSPILPSTAKAFSGLCTIGSLTLFPGTPLYFAYKEWARSDKCKHNPLEGLINYGFENPSLADQETTDIVKNILADVRINDIQIFESDILTIGNTRTTNIGSAIPHAHLIVLPRIMGEDFKINTMQDAEKAFIAYIEKLALAKNQNPNTLFEQVNANNPTIVQDIFSNVSSKKQQYKFLILHEANHQIHHDSKADSLLFGTLAAQATHQVLFSPKRTKTILQNLKKIPVHGTKFILALAYTVMYQRYYEQRADDDVPNDPQLLQSGIDIFTILKNRLDSHINQKMGVPLKHCKKIRDLTDLGHPSIESRIEKLQERLDDLRWPEQARLKAIAQKHTMNAQSPLEGWNI